MSVAPQKIECLPWLPRNILFTQLSETSTSRKPHVVVALANGSVVTHPVNNLGHLGDRRVLVVGSRPSFAAMCRVRGRPSVLVGGSRTALLTWEGSQTGRLRMHPTALQVSLLAMIVAALDQGTHSKRTYVLLLGPRCKVSVNARF
jgi:hypothetical protein